MKKMKTIKKILTGLITVCMLLSASSITALAADLINTNTSGATTVQYTMNSSWEATIPAYINPTEQGKADINEYTVKLSDVVIGSDEKLVGTVVYDGILTEENNIELSYTLCDIAGDVNSGKKIITANAGNPNTVTTYSFGAELTEKPKYAGNYLGTATFNFATVVKNPNEYSLEDIENDEHLFGIGKTKSEYVIAKFNDDYTSVEIFANGDDSDGLMKDFSGFSDPSPMTKHQDTLTNAAIKEGVTNIGYAAFDTCSLLTNVDISETVQFIEGGAFYKCSSLDNIIIPDGVSSIELMTFYGCSKLSNISLPDSLVKIGNYAFRDCTSLINISIPNNVISFGGISSDSSHNGGVFYGCTSLRNVTMPKNLEIIGDLTFYNCRSLRSITIPDGVTAIGYQAFANCSYIPIIDMPNSIISIGENTFGNCSSLSILNISNGITELSKGIFSGCSSLKSVEIPYGVTTIECGAFSSCYKLESVIIPNTVTVIGDIASPYATYDGVFKNCWALKSVELPDGLIGLDDSTFYDCRALESINIPDGITKIDDYMFYNCGLLNNVVINDNVTEIGANAFAKCGFSEITIGKGCISIDSTAFADCKNFTTVNGYSGTYAETWANSNGYTFVAID